MLQDGPSAASRAGAGRPSSSCLSRRGSGLARPPSSLGADGWPSGNRASRDRRSASEPGCSRPGRPYPLGRVAPSAAARELVTGGPGASGRSSRMLAEPLLFGAPVLSSAAVTLAETVPSAGRVPLAEGLPSAGRVPLAEALPLAGRVPLTEALPSAEALLLAGDAPSAETVRSPSASNGEVRPDTAPSSNGSANGLAFGASLARLLSAAATL